MANTNVYLSDLSIFIAVFSMENCLCETDSRKVTTEFAENFEEKKRLDFTNLKVLLHKKSTKSYFLVLLSWRQCVQFIHGFIEINPSFERFMQLVL